MHDRNCGVNRRPKPSLLHGAAADVCRLPLPVLALVCAMKLAVGTAWIAPASGARSGAVRHPFYRCRAAGQWRERWAPEVVTPHGPKPRYRVSSRVSIRSASSKAFSRSNRSCVGTSVGTLRPEVVAHKSCGAGCRDATREAREIVSRAPSQQRQQGSLGCNPAKRPASSATPTEIFLGLRPAAITTARNADTAASPFSTAQ